MRSEDAGPRSKRRIWRILSVALLMLTGGVALLIIERAPILTAIARAWIVDQRPSRADLIVVIGGGLQTRSFAAAKLYHEGIATNIVIARSKLNPTDRIGITQPERVFIERVLTTKGVPVERIGSFGEAVTSTRDEAVALREWLGSHPEVKKIVIPTDLFHTRRVRWIFSRVFRATPVEITVMAIEPEEYKASNWWRNERGLVEFETEVLKSMFYHVKYRGIH